MAPGRAPKPRTLGGMTETPDAVFRLGYVPGVTPSKWARVWRERLPGVRLELVLVPFPESEHAVRSGAVDALLGRLPVLDDGALHAIPMYVETTVVAASRDHLVAAADVVVPEDLVDEVCWQPLDDPLPWAGRRGAGPGALVVLGESPYEHPATTADAIAVVASGSGVVVVPQSLARLHHRKDVEHRPLEGEGVPQSQVALVWRRGDERDLVEELIGIVRGRTVNSSRGRGAAAAKGATDAPETAASTAARRGPRGAAPPRGGNGRKPAASPRRGRRGRR